MNKLKAIPYESICLAHFGCITGDEARHLPDEALATNNKWWQFYEKNADRLDDMDYLLQARRAEIQPGIPEIRPVSPGMKVMFALMSAASALLGKKTAMIDKLVYGDYLAWLALGYRGYQSRHLAKAA